MFKHRYMQLFLYVLVIWSAVVYYGHMRSFEEALNASTSIAECALVVTPLMLKEGIQSVTSYTMFLVILILVSKK
jgi:hypothetical protein